MLKVIWLTYRHERITIVLDISVHQATD